MPKMKTKSGVKKRFRTTASGKVKHGVVGKRHCMLKRSNKFVRQHRGTRILSGSDAPRIRIWAPYGL